jgi:hypothetical protein
MVLLLWLATLGTTSGTRPHRCTPIVVGETRADIRIRIRRIVIRIRIRHTAIRVRVVVPAIDHTAYWVALPTAKLLNICAKRDKIVHRYEFWNETL